MCRTRILAWLTNWKPWAYSSWRGTGMGHGRGFHDTPGHGGGHDILFQAIHDCDVLLARGMGPRLADDLAARGIKPMVTNETDIARALDCLIKGELKEGGFCPEKG